MIPEKIDNYVTAVAEASEASIHIDMPVYLYRVAEGGYVIDTQPGDFSNEKLIMTFINGERQ